jgi:outer membrane protein TolC
VLKITVHDIPSAYRIQLEGKLTGPWVGELENCWRAAEPLLRGRSLEVDLTDVDYSDAAGRYLLAWMRERGARLIAPGLPMQDLLRQITLALLLIAAVVPAAAQDRQVLRLTMKRAVEIAVSAEGSARIQLADESVKQAQSRAAQARAALLPDLDASISQQSQTRNLETFGLRFASPIPGVQFPTFVGPFNVFDARASVRQSVFDFASIRRYQSARTAVGGVRADREHTADVVAANVARAYVAALKADADVESAKANVQLAQALVNLVDRQKRAGSGTGIEVTRARVQLANEEQRLLVASNERRKAHLQLLRTAGLRLDTQIELDEKLSYTPVAATVWEDAKKRALELRSDYKAQAERERAARLSSSATTLERLPSVAAMADYGPTGSGINNALPTRMYGVQVRVPVFDGGRRDARRAESSSQHRQEQVRTRDLREEIELEIRLALDTIASAAEQVEVAAQGLKLADEELSSAQRRYAAGVATSIEVTDAQTRLERARDNHVTALFSHNLARIDLAQAQGAIEEVIR